MTKLFLFDVEGTTTDINFVHKVLFPYSKERMAAFVKENALQNEVVPIISDIKKTVYEEEKRELTTLDEVCAVLDSWIKNDRKHGALKALQGFIWDIGYKSGDFKGHVYEDVKPFFEKLKSLGFDIGIYSSGSVHAQKLIFGYSTAGDLTPLISYYFDTKVGAKREATSYLNILREVKRDASDVTFFSDIPQELSAAKEAGIHPVHLVRPGTLASDFFGIKDFSEFKI